MNGLRGRRIVVTRPEPQADALCGRLAALGAVPLRLPTIAIAPVGDPAPLTRALLALHEWDWVVFTSANGVRHVLGRARELGMTADDWRAVRVAAIGPATANALAEGGIVPAAVPSEYLAERIADVVGEIRGTRFLLLRADLAGAALPERLRAGGGFVEDVVAYHTVPLQADPAMLAELRAGVDAITFTSPSTVRGFATAAGSDWRGLVNGAVIATIGPVTSAAARDLGLEVHVEAREHSSAGLLDALVAHFAQAGAREEAS